MRPYLKILLSLPFLILVGYFVIGSPWKLYAQATTGYTKIGSVPFGTDTFTTPTLTDGTTYNFEVTAANAAGESGPSNIVTGTVPSTGTHTGTLTWTPPTSGGTPTTYNIYSQVVTIPNQPGALGLVIN